MEAFFALCDPFKSMNNWDLAALLVLNFRAGRPIYLVENPRMLICLLGMSWMTNEIKALPSEEVIIDNHGITIPRLSSLKHFMNSGFVQPNEIWIFENLLIHIVHHLKEMKANFLEKCLLRILVILFRRHFFHFFTMSEPQSDKQKLQLYFNFQLVAGNIKVED